MQTATFYISMISSGTHAIADKQHNTSSCLVTPGNNGLLATFVCDHTFLAGVKYCHSFGQDVHVCLCKTESKGSNYRQETLYLASSLDSLIDLWFSIFTDNLQNPDLE